MLFRDPPRPCSSYPDIDLTFWKDVKGGKIVSTSGLSEPLAIPEVGDLIKSMIPHPEPEPINLGNHGMHDSHLTSVPERKYTPASELIPLTDSHPEPEAVDLLAKSKSKVVTIMTSSRAEPQPEALGKGYVQRVTFTSPH